MGDINMETVVPSKSNIMSEIEIGNKVNQKHK